MVADRLIFIFSARFGVREAFGGSLSLLFA
jgi:hypothetical protein